MTGFYTDEQARYAVLALQLAQKEANYLTYTHNTLFNQTIDIKWVKELADYPERAEKVDAFVSRFARLQDYIGNKLLPLFAQLYEEKPNSLLDTLLFAERMGWLESAEYFVRLRRLRNQLVHEYINSSDIFLNALLTAKQGTLTLCAIVQTIENVAKEFNLSLND